MTAHSYKISLSASVWNLAYMRSLKDKYITTVYDFLPTAENIRSLIASLFPNEQIDERDMSLAEQIVYRCSNNKISISLRSYDRSLSRSVSIQEV